MNQDTFVLKHPLGFEISPTLSKQTLASLEGVNKRDMGNTYCWYDIPPAVISGSLINISICYHQHNLESLTLVAIDKSAESTSWESWSAEDQIKSAKKTADWFEKIGYPVGQFPWGEVWADFNQKSGFGGGGVRYA